MSSSSTVSANVGQLPVPHLKLANSQLGGFVTIRKIQGGSGNYGGDVNLYRYPIITALDLTPEQIAKDVRVEMLYYRAGKSSTSHNYSANSEAGWAVASGWIAGANPLPARWTRSGNHTLTGGAPISEDRPNHYQVTAQNQQINVFEYLNGRFTDINCNYFDLAGLQQSLAVVTPLNRLNSKSPVPGKRFAYSGRYRPLRVKFRYIMFDEEANNYITGPATQELLIAHSKHPFIYEPAESAIAGRSVASINPNFDVNALRVWQANNLP